MKRYLLLASLILTLHVSSWASTPWCEGTPTSIFWTTYDDEWMIWNFTPGGSGVSPSETWWGSLVDETVELGDCPPPCTYSIDMTTSFYGGNQWLNNVGGQSLAFVDMAAAVDGTAVGIDVNGSTWMLDGITQQWIAIGSPIGSSARLTSAGFEQTYAIQNGTVYRYVVDTDEWVQFGATTNFVGLEASGNGGLFALNSAGDLMIWNASSSSWIVWGPRLQGATQISIGTGDWSLQMSGGTAAFAVANGRIFHLILGDPWRWTEVPTPFAPVKIQSGLYKVYALDNVGKVWKLDSMYHVSDWYDPYTHWHTTLGATWSQAAQLPAGATSIVSPGPNDVYSYGPAQPVHRFFPDSSVHLLNRAVGYDFTYVAGSSAALLPKSLPNGLDFRGSGNTTITAKCGTGLRFTSQSNFFDKFFLPAYTRVHWLGTQSNCIGVPDPTAANCDYDVESWCTSETTPPSLNPSQVTDAQNPRPLGYWEVGGLCTRLLSSAPWICPNFAAYALQTTGPGGVMPRAVCTKK